MDRETVGNIVLLAIVTLISVVQNGFFAHKVEHESKTQNGRASRGREHLPLNASTLPTKTVWTRTPRSLSCSGARGCSAAKFPAAFAGLMYLFVRQKYFVGYLGERTQSTPGYIFGKRIILFLFLMSLAGIFNYYLIFFFGSDFENYIKTVTTTISPLLLIP
ncbi:arachidonate 5-lipoxygenase-activating protein isoform X2 [Lynx canadensis]|uniref:Arachidonate 5-lipoxygenase-activating protein n=1 Tax=Lynx canadensis TaxID=61383 RepID=A0A667FEC3_LYNCA|nr:arachidonate 5-lipoxygenase-activating protein isoform X2 [Lynx canadensis]